MDSEALCDVTLYPLNSYTAGLMQVTTFFSELALCFFTGGSFPRQDGTSSSSRRTAPAISDLHQTKAFLLLSSHVFHFLFLYGNSRLMSDTLQEEVRVLQTGEYMSVMRLQ